MRAAKLKTVEIETNVVAFKNQINQLQADKGEVSEEISDVYKEAKEAGLHVAALRLACKLTRQEPTKAQAFLNALDAYRMEFGLDHQMALPFDDDEDGAA